MADRILIIGDTIGVFLAVARSLGRRGIEVHVAPTDLSSPGLASRYIRATHILPPYHADPAAWLAALDRLIAAHDYRLIVPCSDSSLAMLHHHADHLGRARLAIANESAMTAFTDKAETRALAERLGVPIAAGETVAPGSTAAELAARLGLPFVLKPRVSYRLGEYRTKQHARIVRDAAVSGPACIEQTNEVWLAEAFFRGDGVGVSVLARSGRILLAWQHRRLEVVAETGASTVRVGEPLDARLLVHVEKLAAATALDGVAMFEFRCDPASGAHVLLEVNPRFWGSLPLAVAAGADFPGALWDMLNGDAVEASPPARTATIKRNMTGEYDRLADDIGAAGSIAGKLVAALAMLARLPTLLSGARFDSWAADDLRPFATERRQLARRLARAFAKRAERVRGAGAD